MKSVNGVLHIGDSARTSTYVSDAARERGVAMSVLPFAPSRAIAHPLLRLFDKGVRGAWWETRLALKWAHAKRVHLHNAIALPHVRWALRKGYALHVHGSDIRSAYADAQIRERVAAAIANASVVFYSTPDLRDLVAPFRPDAMLCSVPIVIRPEELSDRPPEALRTANVSGRYVFFPSRWGAAKGGEAQLKLASELAAALPPEVRMVGLNWGEQAAAAATLGVTLVPKQSHRGFLQLIQHASLCVGQQTGVMGASELEVLALNVPLLMPLNPEWYDGSHPELRDVPTLGRDLFGDDHRPALVAEAVRVLRSQTMTADARRAAPQFPPKPGDPSVHATPHALTPPLSLPSETATWIEKFHRPQRALTTILRGYRKNGWDDNDWAQNPRGRRLQGARDEGEDD